MRRAQRAGLRHAVEALEALGRIDGGARDLDHRRCFQEIRYRMANSVDFQEEVELVLQINGKLRGKIVVPAGADPRAIELAARDSPELKKHAAGAAIRKIVVVPGRLVNVVV